MQSQLPDKTSGDETRPVFYDPKGRRWPVFKWVSLAFAVGLLCVFGLLIASVSLEATLPKLHLPVPVAHALVERIRGALPDRAERRQEAAVLALRKARANLRRYLAQHAAAAVLHDTAGRRPSSEARYALQHLSVISAAKTDALFRPYSSLAIGFYVDWDPASFTSLQENLQSLNVLMPEWLHLSSASGSFVQDDPATQASTLAYIHEHRPGLPVVPLVNNYSDAAGGGFDGRMLAAMLRAPVSRRRAVTHLLSFVTDQHLAGINIDFENVPPTAQPALVTFMAQLYGTFHPRGLSVSMDVPLDDSTYNCHALARWADYLIVMGYDQHCPGTSAGPIAAQPWLMSSLRHRLAEAPASKYVIGIGGYGDDWTDGSTNAATVTYGQALSTARNAGAQIHLDHASLNPTFAYADAEGRLHHVWFLDGVTAWNEIAQTRTLRPRGYALWRLGSEDQSVWAALDNRSDPAADPRSFLRSIACGTGIDSVGQGQILQVTSAHPTPGVRSIALGEPGPVVLQEHIASYPNAYVLTHWGADGGHKIALTFDDGPSPTYTPEILAILRRYRVPATFFIIGSNGVLHPGLVKQIVAQGDEIGNHTFTHPDVSKIPTVQLLLELNATQRFFESTVGRSTLLFRPPYGSDTEPTTPAQIAPIAVATRLGYYTIGMDIDPNDWSNPGTQTIVDRVLSQAAAGAGNVVLLHDGGGNRSQTVAALPAIIAGLRAHHFQLVKISGLMGVPMSAVNPAVTDATFAGATGFGFDLLTAVGNFVPRLFIVGLSLGIAWLAVLVTLAVIGWARNRRTSFASDYQPSVAVIVPAFNEETVIGGTIDSLLASEYPDLEIFVVDDGSADATSARARAAAGADPRVRVVRKSNGGKWSALNFGMRHCGAEIVVALDADTVFNADTILLLVRHFCDPAVAAVAGNAKVGNRVNLLTKLEALEYITSQNLDRRAFSLLNCITVVPGSVGAWRRQAVLDAGGYSGDTLAEDADLTIELLRQGHRIVHDADAMAFTEAPQTIRAFFRQRYRWVYGTIQAYWKHRGAALRRRPGTLGLLALPQALVFKVIFPLLCPVMDLLILYATALLAWQHFTDPGARSDAGAVLLLLYTGLLFAADYLAAAVALLLESGEDWRLLPLLVLQRFFYRQILSLAVYKALARAIRGERVGWGKLVRRGTLCVPQAANRKAERAVSAPLASRTRAS